MGSFVDGKVFKLLYGFCPSCNKLLVNLLTGKEEFKEGDFEMEFFLEKEETIYPKNTLKKLPEEIPEKYKNDFLEAYSIIDYSPKASAALSRRVVQMIIREEFGIKKKSLAEEIQNFIQSKDIPTYLQDAIDAIRQIGNLAAHPIKNENTGQITEVEPGEAEWLIEVLESLFDFTFVQPKRLEERKNKLEEKLKHLKKTKK